MILLVLIFSIFYFLILILIGFKFSNPDYMVIKAGLMKGGGVGFFFSLCCLIIATIIVERNEFYWWYGPPERMNWLVGITAFMAVSGLVLGPIYGFKQASRRKKS